jgi:diguanylate cyclase (GGDEF)-like protein
MRIEVRPSLHSVLRRTLLSAVVLAVLLAGGLLTVFGTLALRTNAGANLHLVARAVGYTLEAAVIFGDEEAAADALALIAGAEDVAQAWVYDRQGRLLVQWTRDSAQPGGPWRRWVPLVLQLAREWTRDRLAWLLLPPVVDEPIRHGGAEIGRVVMRATGDGLAGFVLCAVGVMLCGLALGGLAAASALQRVLPVILAPLQQLHEVARAGRVERSLDRRLPAARIAEFHALGDDVNALLVELQARQQGLQLENAHLAHRASTDSLTGLHNRAAFEQGLAQAIATARQQGGRLAVLFLDGDGFKQINDSLGHEAGDEVLVAMAGRIRSQLRDEFAVLIDSLPDAPAARLMSDAIQLCMAEPIALKGGGRVMASLSIGLAVFPDDAIDAAGLLRAADAAMYRGKRTRADRAGRQRP